MLSAVALVDAHRDRLPEDGREALSLLRVEVDRFQRLVEDLLEISRSDAGSADGSLEPVRLSALVRHALPARLIHLVEVAPGAERLLVRADKRRLERAVGNLVDNAERHGRGLSRVLVAAVDGAAEVAVEDQGPGIEDADRERIFDRFARGRRRPRDSTEGAGLGLSLVTRHLHLMAGSVRVEDRAGGGARFVLSLPVSTDPGTGPAGAEDVEERA